MGGADPRVRAAPMGRRRLVAALLLAVLACLALPLRASAHAYLVVSVPRTGTRLATAPSGLQLLFTQPVALAHSGVQLFNSHFELVSGTDAQVGAGGTSIAVSLPSLANGDYAAIWTVVSADDGHLTDGTIAFSVGPAPPAGSVAARVVPLAPTTGDDDQPRDWPGTLATWLLLVGLALAGGGLAAERTIARSITSHPPPHLSTRVLTGALTVALAGAAIAFVATAGRLHDGSALGGLDPRTWAPAAAVRIGLEDVASIALVGNALGALLLLRDRLVTLGSVVGAMVLVGMRSHPADSSVWGETAIVLHVVVALTWAGSLAYLVAMIWRRRGRPDQADLSEMLAAYARLALLSVLAIVLTGAAATLTQVSSPSELLGTTYGRLLTLKVGVVTWTLMVATLGRWRGLRGGRADTAAVRDVLRAEVIGLTLVTLVTAALANAAPPVPQGLQLSAPGGGAATMLLALGGSLLVGAVGVVGLPMLRGGRVQSA